MRVRVVARMHSRRFRALPILPRRLTEDDENSSDKKKAEVSNDTAVATTGESNGDGSSSNRKRGKKNNKPVQMEMKYNKSFRNAVFLRQVYSAVGGMVVSALFPGISKVFRLLFLR